MRAASLLTPMVLPALLAAQLNTGKIEGVLRAPDGRPLAREPIPVSGGTGFQMLARTNAHGVFSLILAYGSYRIGDASVYVYPLETEHLELVRTSTGTIRASGPPEHLGGDWTNRGGAPRFPEAFSLPGLLLSREPSTVTEPLDFTGLSDNRLGVASPRGLPWTAAQYKLQGLDATDSYQPGMPAVFPDQEAIGAVISRGSSSQLTTSSYGADTGLYLDEPRAAWHGALSTADTGSALVSNNLPLAEGRGLVQQADYFHWFTRDHADIGGPLGRRVDLFASATGQWASQSRPLETPDKNQRSRLLFGNARGRVRASSKDRFDALYSGSRIDLSDGGMPAGLEALTGNRGAPSFVLPGGFPGQAEVDHLDAIQVGWTHLLSWAAVPGIIEMRYGYNIAHLNARTMPNGESRVELFGGSVYGAPPLGNLAVRPRHEISAAWQLGPVHLGPTRHEIDAGGSWKASAPHNRFSIPSDRILITAGGVPAFVLSADRPMDSRSRMRSSSVFAADQITLQPSFRIEMGILADFARGSAVYGGHPQGDLISWNSPSPRAGFAWRMPHLHGVVMRGTYSRLYAPLAGRYLDYGNPDALGGEIYQWITSNLDGPFQSNQQGRLLLRFGGPYSSISPVLRRPYSDIIDAGVELHLPHSTARIHAFRRDEKNRMAGVDTGLPNGAFSPVYYPDPGPDGIPGTFDDQTLTVYAQDPATSGKDHYVLTNPPGLRELNSGVVAEAGADWRGLLVHASFSAEKSYGPTNPGNAVYQNDPGVLGSLFLDPNTAVHASGRIFTDRAFVGKAQAAYRFPASWGGVEVATAAVYTDGLVFARQLLVTGLPQGPVVVATTVRGSPEGGNRAQYALNWNLRFARELRLAQGSITVCADILNVTDAGNSLQQNDLSGPSFNLRLPVAIQPPRFVRFGVRYAF